MHTFDGQVARHLRKSSDEADELQSNQHVETCDCRCSASCAHGLWRSRSREKRTEVGIELQITSCCKKGRLQTSYDEEVPEEWLTQLEPKRALREW